MNSLPDRAIARTRALPPGAQDEIARMLLLDKILGDLPPRPADGEARRPPHHDRHLCGHLIRFRSKRYATRSPTSLKRRAAP